jgi:hypothetical protein
MYLLLILFLLARRSQQVLCLGLERGLKPLPNDLLVIIIKIILTTNYQLLLNCSKVHRACSPYSFYASVRVRVLSRGGQTEKNTNSYTCVESAYLLLVTRALVEHALVDPTDRKFIFYSLQQSTAIFLFIFHLTFTEGYSIK